MSVTCKELMGPTKKGGEHYYKFSTVRNQFYLLSGIEEIRFPSDTSISSLAKITV